MKINKNQSRFNQVTKIRSISILSGVMLFVGLSIFGFNIAKSSPPKPDAEKEVTKALSPPKTFTLQSENFSPTVNLTGTVEANKQVSINSAIGGRVATINVETGDFVKKGQILSRLSAHDNSAEVQYQNALNTFHKAENTVKNNVHQSKIGLQNAEQSLEKAQRTQKESYDNTFQLLITQAESTETSLKAAYNWADRITLATNEAQKRTYDGAYGKVGSNQTLEKQSIKNAILKSHFKIKNKYQEKEYKAPVFDSTPAGEKISLAYAQEHLEVATSLRSIVRRINALIIKTPHHKDFSSNKRRQFEQESDQYLQSLDQTIVNLDNAIKNATSQREGTREAIQSAENQVSQALAGLDLAKASSESDLNTAQSQIRIAQLSRNELSLKAPFDGIIITKNIEAGQLVSAGTSLLEIADMSKMKVKTAIPDVWVADAQNDDVKTEIHINGIRNQVFLGKVEKVEPAVDPQTRKVGIEIAFDKPTELIRIGMFAQITVIIPEMEAYFIPRKFLKSDFDGTYIKLTDGSKKYVEKGFEDKNRVQVNFPGIANKIEIQL